MTATKVWSSGAWVDLSGGAAAVPGAFPVLLNDTVVSASSERSSDTAVASATPHTAGNWNEVDSALSAAAGAVIVAVRAASNSSTTNTSTLLDIGTGAAASEVVWATIGVGYLANPATFVVPGVIAAGTRVAIRARSAVAGKVIDTFVTFASAAEVGAPVTYQADIATSRGLTITAPGSLNTKGAWTELVASTASDLLALTLCPQGAAGTTMSSSGGVLLDIGVGGAGSEAVVIPDVFLAPSSSEGYSIVTPLTYVVDIPAGSRISARYARANSGNALDLVVVGTPPA